MNGLQDFLPMPQILSMSQKYSLTCAVVQYLARLFKTRKKRKRKEKSEKRKKKEKKKIKREMK
jgi:hypothetical protein